MVSTEHIVREIPEDPDNPYRLGRKVNHDPRSVDYPHARRAMPVVTRDRWPRGIPILDQGNLGSCVANTGVAVCSTSNVDVLEPRSELWWDQRYDVSPLDQTLAVEWYRRITRADPFPGSWEPDDTGSDGTTMAQKLLEWGVIVEYRHAFGGLADVLDALMTGPVMMGSNWYSGMFQPDANGFLVTTGYVAGGHEYLLNGKVQYEDGWVEMDNSWGAGWGMGGRAKLDFHVLERLLAEDGDAAVLKFVPTLVDPPPTPEPEPTPEPVEPAAGCMDPGRALRRWGRQLAAPYRKP